MQGHKWVFMHNINKQTLVVPFYVCNVTQPIMSVTRLAEQGFSTQLNETPRITHSKGFNSTLKQREGLYFLPVTLVALPANMRLEVNQTAEGTTARVTPVTLTPAGMEILRNRNDLWTFNCRNFLVRVHRTHRKALFMPDNNCPVPTERLENNRRTVIQRPNDNTEVLEETYQDLDKKQQKEGHPRAQLDRRNMVQSETGNTPSRQHTAPPALPSATEQTQTTAQQATSGKPPAVTSTNVPAYRKEASHWSETNRISNGPDTASNNSNSTSKGSESNTGLLVQGRSILETRTRPAKKELVHPATNRCCTRCGNADNMETTKRKATLDIEWTGSTNSEENTVYKDKFNTGDPREQQEAGRARGAPTPQQPTEQERREHEPTHLPYRSWCSICVQSKGRQDNHPKQTSKTTGIQVDLMYYKAQGEQQTTSVLTAVEVETGMCMAVQPEDKTTAHAVLVNMPTTISDGMRQGTRNSQQHRLAIRPRRFHHRTFQDGGNSDGQQHSSETITGLHITGTRQCGTFSLACQTRSIPAQQVLRPLGWQHKLLQTME